MTSPALYVAGLLPDLFTAGDVAAALSRLQAGEAASLAPVGGQGDRFAGADAADVMDELLSAEAATLADAGPPRVYRLLRDALPL